MIQVCRRWLAGFVWLIMVTPLLGTPLFTTCTVNGTQADCRKGLLDNMYTVPLDLPASLEKLSLHSPRLILQSDSFSHLPNLRQLDLTMCILEQLPPGVLASMPNLTSLILNINNLNHLDADMFRGNILLQQLSVVLNNLRVLAEDTFVHLPKLEELNLSGNHLEVLPERLFSANTNLRVLKLNGNALITLSSMIFKELIHLEILELGTNKLTHLEHDLFSSNYELKLLYLVGNNLTTVNSQMLNATQIYLLYINNNPWHCDYRMRDFVQNVDQHGVVLVGSAKCATPPDMADKDILLLPQNQTSRNVAGHQ